MRAVLVVTHTNRSAVFFNVMSTCQKIMVRFYRKRVINIYRHNCEVPNPKGIAWKCESLATNVRRQTVHIFFFQWESFVFFSVQEQILL